MQAHAQYGWVGVQYGRGGCAVWVSGRAVWVSGRALLLIAMRRTPLPVCVSSAQLDCRQMCTLKSHFHSSPTLPPFDACPLSSEPPHASCHDPSLPTRPSQQRLHCQQHHHQALLAGRARDGADAVRAVGGLALAKPQPLLSVLALLMPHRCASISTPTLPILCCCRRSSAACSSL